MENTVRGKSWKTARKQLASNRMHTHTHTHCIDNDARKILNALTVHRNAVVHFTVRSVDLIILPPIEILGKFYFVVVRSSM